MSKQPNVLVVAIDTEADFMFEFGKLPVKGAQDLIGPMIAYVATLDPAEVAAFLATFDMHTLGAFMTSKEHLGDPDAGIPGFPMHCEKDEVGSQNVINLRIVDALGIPVHALEKSVFDMWEEATVTVQRLFAYTVTEDESREAFIERLEAQGVDTIRIFGVAADFCVMWAIRGFLKHGFKIEIVERLTAGILRDMATTVAEEFPGQVELI